MTPIAPLNRHLLLWAMIALLLVTAALTIPQLDTTLWQDEYLSVYDAGGGDFGPLTPRGVWLRLADRNPWHAPGYFILLHLWGTYAVGWEPLVLRLLSVYGGLLALAWTYRLLRDFVTAEAGLYAVAVLGTSAFFLHYLHELRMYSLIAMFQAALLWAYLSLLRHNYRWGWRWALFTVSFLLLQFQHYFALLPLAALGVYHLFFAPRRGSRGWWGIGLAAAFVQVLFLAWVPVLLEGLQSSAEQEIVRARALSTVETLRWWLTGVGNGSVILALALVALTTWAVVVTLRRNTDTRPGTRLLLVMAAGTLLLLIIGNALAEVMHSGRLRYMMVLWVPWGALFGIALADLGRWRRWLPPVTALAWGIFGVMMVGRVNTLFAFDGLLHILPTNELARVYAPHSRPGDFLYVFPPDNQSTWHYRFVADYYLNDMGDGYTLVNVRDEPGQPTDDPITIFEGIGGRERVWVAHMPDATPPEYPPFAERMSAAYHRCTTTDRDGLRLTLYTASPLCCAADAPRTPRLAFSQGVSLVDHTPLPATATDALTLQAAWAGGDTPELASHSIGLYLMPDAETVTAQTNIDLPDYAYACVDITLPLTDVPPGRYTLRTAVYNRDTGERLTSSANTLPDLGTITIEAGR